MLLSDVSDNASGKDSYSAATAGFAQPSAVFVKADSNDSHDQLKVQLLLATLFALLDGEDDKEKLQPKNNFVLPAYKLRQAQEFIENHLHEEITPAKVADLVGISRCYFTRLFKGATGVAPHRYIQERRIRRAQTLLIKTDLPLIEISLQVGYQNQSHFTVQFRKHTNTTPKSYREINRC